MRDRSSKALILATLLLAAACGNDPVSPAALAEPRRVLTQTVETARVVIYYAPGDFIEAARLEAYCAWAEGFIGTTLPKKIDYYKFKDREMLTEFTRSRGTGWADPSAFQVWTYMPFLGHECLHLYSLVLGDPPILFSEGVAVAYQVDPLNGDFVARELNGEPVQGLARGLKAQGLLYPLESLLDDRGWYAANFTRTYVEAGSFVRYLADTQGIERIKDVFRVIRQTDPKEVVKEKFLAVFGFTIQDAEAAWLAFLD